MVYCALQRPSLLWTLDTEWVAKWNVLLRAGSYCILHSIFIFKWSFLLGDVKLRLNVDGIKKELGMMMAGTQLVVVVFICMCEMWAFDEQLVTRSQKINLLLYYSPWLAVPGIMIVDMFTRVCKRVEAAEKNKRN